MAAGSETKTVKLFSFSVLVLASLFDKQFLDGEVHLSKCFLHLYEMQQIEHIMCCNSSDQVFLNINRILGSEIFHRGIGLASLCAKPFDMHSMVFKDD